MTKEGYKAMNIVNQIFDYLIENGIPISVDFRQAHNDKLDKFVQKVIAPKAEQVDIEEKDSVEKQIKRGTWINNWLRNFYGLDDDSTLNAGDIEELCQALLDSYVESNLPKVDTEVSHSRGPASSKRGWFDGKTIRDFDTDKEEKHIHEVSYACNNPIYTNGQLLEKKCLREECNCGAYRKRSLQDLNNEEDKKWIDKDSNLVENNHPVETNNTAEISVLHAALNKVNLPNEDHKIISELQEYSNEEITDEQFKDVVEKGLVGSSFVSTSDPRVKVNLPNSNEDWKIRLDETNFVPTEVTDSEIVSIYNSIWNKIKPQVIDFITSIREEDKKDVQQDLLEAFSLGKQIMKSQDKTEIQDLLAKKNKLFFKYS